MKRKDMTTNGRTYDHHAFSSLLSTATTTFVHYGYVGAFILHLLFIFSCDCYMQSSIGIFFYFRRLFPCTVCTFIGGFLML